ncbi:MAG: glycosyltransferase [Micavibrio sp.]
MKIVLVSSHDAQSRRKTGFHFWKDILARQGHEVRFVTVGSSRLSLLRRNAKHIVPPYNRWVATGEKIIKYTWIPLFHPFYTRSRLLGKLLSPLFRLYPFLMPAALLKEIKNADLFIIENGVGGMLAPTFKRKAPEAAFIYNASDRMDVLTFHPLVKNSIIKNIGLFDFIRLNAEEIAQDFPSNVPAHYIPQAIDKDAFDRPHTNPYAKEKNAISIGDMLFDSFTLEILAQHYPDWTFHIFGSGAKIKDELPNILFYGERNFDDIIPYIKHADIGIAPYLYRNGAEYLHQSSLKLVQYSYCKLPIITSRFAAKAREHAFGYNEKDTDTILRAFENAKNYNRETIDISPIKDWENIVGIFIDEALKTKDS